MFVFSSLFVLSKFNNFVCISLFELILPMFATRKPRRTSSPFKVILTEEKDIICFYGQRNKILAAKLQMFSDFAIEIRRFCSIKREICRIKRRIEVFRVCLELRFFGFFRCLYPCFFAVFSPRKIDFLICSKKSVFFGEKFGVLLGQNGVLFYQKGVSRK